MWDVYDAISDVINVFNTLFLALIALLLSPLWVPVYLWKRWKR